jgi:hypothetical protein
MISSKLCKNIYTHLKSSDPFSISGPAGSSVPISMTGKYDFKGMDDVKTSHANI